MVVGGRGVEGFGWQVRPLHLTSVNFYDFAELLVSLSDDVFERRLSTGNCLFCFILGGSFTNLVLRGRVGENPGNEVVVLPKFLDKSPL